MGTYLEDLVSSFQALWFLPSKPSGLTGLEKTTRCVTDRQLMKICDKMMVPSHVCVIHMHKHRQHLQINWG